MHSDAVTRAFDSIGARLKQGTSSRLRNGRTYDLNVERDRHGEFYSLALLVSRPAPIALHVAKDDRHLLLYLPSDDGADRFLCGHDERHWFVAGISDRVTTVPAAKRSLLPVPLRDRVPERDLNRRDNTSFTRQGEWFFVRATPPSTDVILANEPLVRNRRSKPHMVENIVRFGGIPVVLHRGREYSEAEWNAFIDSQPTRPFGERRLVKDPEVYARGRVSHADHATITLVGWHRVYTNAEAPLLMETLSFYD